MRGQGIWPAQIQGHTVLVHLFGGCCTSGSQAGEIIRTQRESSYAFEQLSLLGADHKRHGQKALKSRQWLGPVATVDLSEDLVGFLASGFCGSGCPV